MNMIQTILLFQEFVVNMFHRNMLIGFILLVIFFSLSESGSQCSGNFQGNCLGCACSCYYNTITRFNTSLAVSHGTRTCVGGSCTTASTCVGLCNNISLCSPHFAHGTCYRRSGANRYFLGVTFIWMIFIFYFFVQ